LVFHPIDKQSGEYMRKGTVKLIPFAFLTACAGSGGTHEPPRATSPESAVKVRIHKTISGDNVTFTIDDDKIYRFGNSSDYEFTTEAGSYMFGYTQGHKKCYAEVMLNAGIPYVFNLAPDCTIEMQ
jgi:hypothetical protein